jgi:hypothetical protein
MEYAKDAHLERMPREVSQAVTTDPKDLGHHTFRCMWTDDGAITR